MMKNSKYYFFRRLTKKYRLAIQNDGTFEERVVVKTTPLMVVSVVLVFGFLAILSSYLIVSRVNDSGNTTKERQGIVENYRTIDSLKLRVERTDLYLKRLKIILSGGVIGGDSSVDFKSVGVLDENINLDLTKNDTLFRLKMEKKSHGDYISNSYNNTVCFFTPLSGTFTEKYNVRKNHYGVDIVSVEGSIINSIADGVVIMDNWTKETGFVIGVQHSDGFLSFYKHNSKNLKNIGDYVKSGEGIAIIGSSGELSSGPHLHFELWKNGESVNPENYILF